MVSAALTVERRTPIGATQSQRLIHIKAMAPRGWQHGLDKNSNQETTIMTTMTMPAVIERASPRQAHGVSHFTPFLVAMLLLVASGVVTMLISGPMH